MFSKYYLEIKNRFLLLILTWLSTVLLGYFYKEVLLFICIKPCICDNSFIIYFIFTDIKEVFSVYFKLIFFLGNQVLMLYFLFHFLSFLSLGLYKYEYRSLKLIFYTSIFFWFFSLFIFYKVVFPTSLNFFLSFQMLTSFKFLNFHFEAKLNEYFNLYIMFYYTCIFYCQIFVFLFIFFDYIYLNLKLIKRFRKVFYFSFIFFSTLVTPPDIVSQIIFSVFLIFIYEVLIFINLLCLIFKKFTLVAN